jgi:glyoxylase-like metal-dependent hydrolase (beta-lactamase superfamily II)/ferredoxin
MAALAHRLPTNVPGDFYVDRRCIDCNTCNWLAPASFDRRGAQSRVFRQPASPAERRRAEMALLACPVAAIGTRDKHDLAAARAAFPEPIADGVHHCGYHAPSSYGAASYLIVRPSGNILIDSPRFAGPLVRQLEQLGGVAAMFLTHRDDVADHARFAAHFGCRRILHKADVGRDTRAVEVQIEGEAPIRLDDDVTLIPVPGHTRGSVCLLYRRTFLFSGDHVAWDPDEARIAAFRDTCWHDWDALKRSMARLATFRFEWILPGHGRRCHFPAPRMAAEMRRCLDALARD